VVELQKDTNTNNVAKEKGTSQVIAMIPAGESIKKDVKEVSGVVAGEDEVDWSDPDAIFNNLDAFIRS